MAHDIIVTVADAQNRMEELIDLALSGRSVIIDDESIEPVALVPWADTPPQR